LKKIFIIILLIIVAFEANAQISAERLAISRIEKGKWLKAEHGLYKSLKKDSLNAEARYGLSKLYFSPAYPNCNIDSAYRYVQSALVVYGGLSTRQRDRLKRFPLDSNILIEQRRKIDTAAFERAKKINTEKSYIDFIAQFESASQQEVAMELRNEVAFVDALKINTYSSFLTYLTKYPKSSRAGEARRRYEKLLFEEKTKSGKLAGYEDFLRDYPQSLHRKEVEKNIFEISTAGGTSLSLTKFLAKYSQPGFYYKKATDILYHIEKESDGGKRYAFKSDSIELISRLEKGYLIPILKDGKFGFMTGQGKEILSPRFTGIHESYLCGAITTDYLVTSEGISGRSGNMIMTGKVEQADDLGFGLLKLKMSGCWKVIHKSGYIINDSCVEDAKVISGHYLAIRKDKKWGLFAFNGRQLLPYRYEEIETLDRVIILNKTGKKILVTVDQIANLANKVPLNESVVYDEIRQLATDQYLVRNGTLEGVINSALVFVVPPERYSITQSPYGFVIEKNKKYRVNDVSQELRGKEFDQINFYGDWIGLRETGNTSLYHGREKRFLRKQLDSLWFENHVAFTLRNDSLKVYFNSGRSLDFESKVSVKFIKSPDSTIFFYVSEKNRNSVYTVNGGAKLFSAEFENLDYLGQGFFLIGKGGKKGLVDESGKIVLPIEYTAIVSTGLGIVSLLKEQKFGLFNMISRKLIKPSFERNVIVYDEDRLLAFKDGYYGFMNWNTKSLSAFEFEEVQAWNDSIAMVKRNFQWSLYEINARKTVISKIKDFHSVSDHNDEKIIVAHLENFYGVLSNKRGELIPASYTDIINLGTADEPLYFAEKHIEEAGIYVIIYFDRTGKILRKQAFEEEEYGKIYCDEN
jgi:hypothetical protein